MGDKRCQYELLFSDFKFSPTIGKKLLNHFLVQLNSSKEFLKYLNFRKFRFNLTQIIENCVNK